MLRHGCCNGGPDFVAVPVPRRKGAFGHSDEQDQRAQKGKLKQVSTGRLYSLVHTSERKADCTS